ncbi:hypothetical protein EC968_004656 [Mortierella alpina]|nr:hypothetical protein EC968_004656 [Mortierella alpina]
MDSPETVGVTATISSREAPKQQLPWYLGLSQNKGLLLALVSMAQMLDLINVASVTIVLPDIMKDVGFEVDELQWVSSAYALTYGGFLLIGGRLGDLFGHRRIFILGLTWFSIWSVVNGFAKTPVIMSISRALQGMGAGFTIPCALAILTTTYPEGPERTKALAVFGGTAALGSVAGVLFGGIFGSTIGVVVIPAEKGLSHIEDRRLDYVGITSFTIGIVAVIYYLSEGPGRGWAKPITLAPFLIGLMFLLVFVAVEYKIEYPIMPLRIWRSRWLFLIGSGVLWAQIKASSSYWSIAFPALILNFLGLSPVWLSCQLNSVADAVDEDQGVVGAVYNVALQVGGPIGIAIANILANDRNPATAFGPALLPGYHVAFYASAVMAGVGLVFTVVFASNSDPPRTKPDGSEKNFTSTSGDKESMHSTYGDSTVP